ncbi:Coiled-coil domain-containing protein 115 [Phytophthora citrophthora]|uniref:Vacuolar ATPase assembly protein VMA22 n=1 Tax=Phytophthora citrophthora TaxID=4793 RepID=A0AAD9GRP4_9STRA|nr:Coiled-coil domain-containing protein 115 [Phytophthora citrophthora]
MTDADKLLLESVEALEEYLDEHKIANTKLKQGFLMLTKAKLRLPEHALTEISYHEEFEASRLVTLDSEGNWRLQDASEIKEQEADKKNSSLHRRSGKSKEKEEPTRTATDTATSKTDTLLWFSSLPPSDLRQAQKLFLSGVQALLVTAATAKKVQRAVKGVGISS